jgi:hypothetical protein
LGLTAGSSAMHSSSRTPAAGHSTAAFAPSRSRFPLCTRNPSFRVLIVALLGPVEGLRRRASHGPAWVIDTFE